MNLLRAAILPMSLCTSFLVKGSIIVIIALVLSGFALILLLSKFPFTDSKDALFKVEFESNCPKVGKGLFEVCYVVFFIHAHYHNVIDICNDVPL
jgi:hypothetical protein